MEMLKAKVSKILGLTSGRKIFIYLVVVIEMLACCYGNVDTLSYSSNVDMLL